MNQQNNSHETRQRKMLLVLPLLIIPFLTMGFWALGGGKTTAIQTGTDASAKGINPILPGVQFPKENPADKLRYYELAADDSIKTTRQARNDAWLQFSGSRDSSGSAEAKIHQKLAQLNAVLETTPPTTKPEQTYKADIPASPDTDRLEHMIQSLQEKDTISDPELQQINSLLDKIIAIQHPGNNKPQQALDSLAPPAASLPVIKTDSMVQGFFSLEENDSLLQEHRAIEAIIPEERILTEGAVLKMRLLTDLTIGNSIIPSGTDIYGTSNLQGERLLVRINSIRSASLLLPVNLSVYDMDGLEGIYAPAALSRDVLKQSADNSLSAISSLDPSIGMQAASAGIETARQLLSKKIKRVSISVKAGYRLLLKDNH